MDILGQSAALVAIASFALGSSVVVRNVRNKLYLSFAGLLCLIALWALAFFLEKVYGGGFFYRIHLFLNVWLAPVSLGFIRSLVRITNPWSQRLFVASGLLAIVLSVALILGLDLTTEAYAPIIRECVLFAPGVLYLQLAQLMWIDQMLKQGIRIEPKTPTVGLVSRRLVYLGAGLALLLSTMDHIPFLGTALPTIGNVVLCIYLYFVSQAILQQRLMNFSAAVSRFVVLAGAAIALTFVYVLMVSWVEDSEKLLFWVNSYIASLIILIFLRPLEATVGFLTRALLNPEQRRLEALLREASAGLATTVTRDALADRILETTQLVLRPDSAAFYLLRPEGAIFERIRSTGTEAPLAGGQKPPAEIPITSLALITSVRARGKGDLPILLDQIIETDIERAASRARREELTATLDSLRATGANLVIPLFDEDVMLAFVALQSPRPPAPWGGNWSLLSLLYPFYVDAAHALRSLAVFVRAREKARLAELGEMAAGLAHEIRNPLSSIKGAAQFLESSTTPDPKFLRVIVEETDRLNRVVTQFLDYSKPWPAEFRPLDLVALVARTLENFQHGIPAELRPRLALVFLPPASPIEISGSAEQLQQLLLNLLQNAVRACAGTPLGKIEVVLRVAGREAILSVSDSGTGIPPANLEKVFTPFFTTAPGGTGLGLSISQRIVELHHGRIEAKNGSNLGGASFMVSLPTTRSNSP